MLKQHSCFIFLRVVPLTCDTLIPSSRTCPCPRPCAPTPWLWPAASGKLPEPSRGFLTDLLRSTASWETWSFPPTFPENGPETEQESQEGQRLFTFYFWTSQGSVNGLKTNKKKHKPTFDWNCGFFILTPSSSSSSSSSLGCTALPKSLHNCSTRVPSWEELRGHDMMTSTLGGGGEVPDV